MEGPPKSKRVLAASIRRLKRWECVRAGDQRRGRRRGESDRKPLPLRARARRFPPCCAPHLPPPDLPARSGQGTKSAARARRDADDKQRVEAWGAGGPVAAAPARTDAADERGDEAARCVSTDGLSPRCKRPQSCRTVCPLPAGGWLSVHVARHLCVSTSRTMCCLPSRAMRVSTWPEWAWLGTNRPGHVHDGRQR